MGRDLVQISVSEFASLHSSLILMEMQLSMDMPPTDAVMRVCSRVEMQGAMTEEICRRRKVQLRRYSGVGLVAAGRPPLAIQTTMYLWSLCTPYCSAQYVQGN